MRRAAWLATLIAAAWVGSASAEGPEIWRYKANEPITFFKQTALGNLVVGAGESMMGIDEKSGEEVWVRNVPGFREGGFALIPLSPFAAVLTKNRDIRVINVETGETAWDMAATPMNEVHGYLALTPHDLLLLYGITATSKKALVAVDLATGVLRWQQPEFFDKKPELQQVDGIKSLLGHQPPIYDTESTVILYLSKDGPIKLNVESGELVWRCASLKGKDVPMLSALYPPILHHDGVLYTPFEKKLTAISTTDGKTLWETKKGIKGSIVQMEMATEGLVVRGIRPLDEKPNPFGPRAFIDVRDPETGASRWSKPFSKQKGESIAPFKYVDGHIYVGDKNRFFDIQAADGSYEELASYDFQNGEEPGTIQIVGDDMRLMSPQNIVTVGHGGAVKYAKYYPPPGAGLLANIGKGALFLASAMSQSAAANEMAQPGFHATASFNYNPFIKERFQHQVGERSDYFIYTSAPDGSREGFSLVRLDRADGRELGRLWLDERSPDYLVDEFTGVVFVKSSDDVITAHQFYTP